jgi:hypothetical protein
MMFTISSILPLAARLLFCYLIVRFLRKVLKQIHQRRALRSFPRVGPDPGLFTLNELGAKNEIENNELETLRRGLQEVSCTA